MLMWWAAEVARERGVPRALYWIQPATMLAVYYHYFHGYERTVTEHAVEPGFTVSMPGLPPMTIRDLPSFFTNFTDGRLAAAFGDVRRTFQQLDLDVGSGGSGAGGSKRAMVLVNTVEELVSGALASVPELDVFPVGPAVVSLFTEGEGGTSTGSVVCVSFGSMSTVSKPQKDELKRGLAASGRAYLWVVRNNNRVDGFDVAGDVRGMVVGWCDQVRVLSHPAVGCFVTHCGWNSTLEAVVCGAPVVAVPQWSDQDTNARLVVQWGVGRFRCNARALLLVFIKVLRIYEF
uniref:Glycosyltransferase n=1 Tax=Hordeum vulgare subsp. vulgare TaxID=112509 RepID=A0A8I6Y4Q9_HORVV